jgi:ribosomal protein L11
VLLPAAAAAPAAATGRPDSSDALSSIPINSKAYKNKTKNKLKGAKVWVAIRVHKKMLFMFRVNRCRFFFLVCSKHWLPKANSTLKIYSYSKLRVRQNFVTMLRAVR